mgnify:CR=1 FL=1
MKKTVDGRIIDKRVIIDKKLLKSILLDIKIKNKISWKEFAKKLSVSEHTLMHDWLQKIIPFHLMFFIALLV